MLRELEYFSYTLLQQQGALPSASVETMSFFIRFFGYRMFRILFSVAAALFAVGLTGKSVNAASFTLDFQPVLVCSSSTNCPTTHFTDAGLDAIFAPADVDVNILAPVILVDAALTSLLAPDLLDIVNNTVRPGVSYSNLEGPATIWFSPLSGGNVTFKGRSAAVIGGNISIDRLVARSIGFQVGADSPSLDTCDNNNLLGVGRTSAGVLCDGSFGARGTSLTNTQISAIQTSSFVTPNHTNAVPLPAGFPMLLAGLGSLLLLGRRRALSG